MTQEVDVALVHSELLVLAKELIPIPAFSKNKLTSGRLVQIPRFFVSAACFTKSSWDLRVDKAVPVGRRMARTLVLSDLVAGCSLPGTAP